MLCSKTNLLFKISKFSTLLRIILDSLTVNKGLPSVGNKNVMWRQKTKPIGNQQVARGRFNVKAVGMRVPCLLTDSKSKNVVSRSD